MYSLKRNTPFKYVWSFLRLYSSGRRTHYEVLNLHKNCTDKEIKDAFIQMSKEYHPDRNKSSKAQENFVRILEAYNVLGKPSSRAQYDQMSEVGGYSYVYKTHVPYNLRKNPRYAYYNADTKSTNSTNSDSYYGVKGVHKLPNIALVMICFGVAVIGVILQVIVIRESYFMHRKKTQEKSMKLAEELERVRDAARGKSRDMQTQVLLDKIVTAANPSVATASLGQALAEEKK